MNKQTYFKNLFHWNQHCSSLVYCLCEYWRQNHWNPRLQTRYDFNERRFLKWKSPFFNFCYSFSPMMMIAHQKSLTVVFFFGFFFCWSRLKRRREAVVLEVWLGIGLKWISTPALHIAMGSLLKKLSSLSPLLPGPSSLMASWNLRNAKEEKC